MNALEQTVVTSAAVIFLISSALNIFGPEFVKVEFEQWNYPNWLRFAVGAVEFAAAVAFIFPGFKLFGAYLALTVLAGVFFSLAKTREWLRMMLPFLLASICIGLIVSGKGL
jgi:uncharacterized membrane protein YphA (DoxX/SURF4 family)